MQRTLFLRLFAWLALSLAITTPAAADDGASRFQLSGEIRTLSRSDDGRFAFGASVKMTPEQASADGRFVMKAVNVPEAGCDPLLELFANGFEGP